MGNTKTTNTSVVLKDSNGVVLTGVTKTADFNTQWYSLDEVEWFGVAVDQSAFAGTSETLDIRIQCTADSSVASPVIFRYPGAANAATLDSAATNQAVLTQIPDGDTDAQVMGYWRNVLPRTWRMRVQFDYGGTPSAGVIDNAYLIRCERYA